MIDKKDKLAALRLAALTGVAAAALMAGPAFAQEAEDDGDEIVVTGSRLTQANNYTAVGPMSVITSEQIDIAAKANLGDLLEELPSVSFYGDGANANNGSGGLATVNIRGLGTSRSLVLMNGRRVAPVGSGINNLVDLQIFPTSAVERVEVFKDGAAAVYGADAVTGVINIITPTDFDGIEATFRAGTSERGDGETWNTSVMAGVTNDRGNVLVAVGYREQEGVYQSDRAISDCPRLEAAWGGAVFGVDAANDQCSGSSFIPAGRFYTSGGSRTIDENGNDQPFSFFNDAYNFNPLNYLRTPSSSVNALVTANYELSEYVNFTMEMMYNKRRSQQDLAPVPLGNGAQFTYGLVIPGDNPFNIYNEDVQYRKRMLDVGPRLFDQESDTFRTVIGLNGTLPESSLPFFSGGSWDVSYTADMNNGTDKNGNMIDMLRVQQALDTEITANTGAGTVTVGGVNYQCADLLARQQGCEPLNMFGPGSITPGAAEYIRLNTVDKFSSLGTQWQATFRNTLAELPAGPLQALIGIEGRSLRGVSDIDGAVENGYTSGNPATSTEGTLTSTDYFGEVQVPLIAGQPMFEELTLSAAGRISSYDSFDAGETYRLALSWSPVQDLRFRGTLSSSFRAPSISNLFNGGSGGFPTYTDPCAGTVDPVSGAIIGVNTTQCNAQGVGVGSDFLTTSTQLLSFTVGARLVGDNLLPETGKQRTLGVVYTPSNNFLSKYNFSAALDYYDIEINNPINVEGLQSIINDCYIDGDVGQCGKITRQTGGDILRVDRAFGNSLGSETGEGIDFTASGSTEVGNGDLGVFVAGTYIIGRVDYDDDGVQFDSAGRCYGFVAACFNEWKINSTVSYSTDKYRVAWSMRALSPVENDQQRINDYLGGFFGGIFTDAEIATLAESYMIKDWYFYNDVNVRYSVTDTLSVSAGVDNVFDKQPPYWKEVDGFFSPTENTPFGTYDTVGRFFYFQVDKSF